MTTSTRPNFHDELLEEIDSFNDSCSVSSRLALSLRAVVELHSNVQSKPKSRGKSGLRSRCTECGFAFPCPTIQIIQENLEKVT